MIRTRDSGGRFLPGVSGNPEGRLPAKKEAEYLNVTMRACPPEKWAEVIALALEDALGENPHVRARAREWLGKQVIGDTTQVHQLLYKDERSFEIHVVFGDNGDNIVDVEPLILDED